MQDTNGYNSVAQALLDPFDDKEISQRKGAGEQVFSYVAPELYRYRLLKVFEAGFKFHVHSLSIGESGVAALAHFVGSSEQVDYDIQVAIFEPWGKDGSGNIINRDQTMMKLDSAGIKAVSREIGLGLHLYEKAQRTVSSNGAAPAATASAPAVAAAPGSYDRNAPLGFGKKHPTTAWKDVPDEYLTWLTGTTGPNAGTAKAELAFRQANSAATGAAQAAQSSKAGFDVPF